MENTDVLKWSVLALGAFTLAEFELVLDLAAWFRELAVGDQDRQRVNAVADLLLDEAGLYDGAVSN